jgi:hypothetical protein
MMKPPNSRNLDDNALVGRLNFSGYSQVNDLRAVLAEPDGVIPPLSAGTRRLPPFTEGSVAEESMVNCFEMVPTDTEQVLNRTIH